MTVEAKIRLAVEGATLAKGEMDRVAAGLGGMTNAAGVLRSALGSLGVGLSAGAFIGMVKGAIDAADALNDMSQRVGIAVKDLAAYELAAKQSGTSMEAIAKGVKGVSATMASHGDALRAAGITATSTSGVMQQLADVFSKMPDGMEKTNLAVKIFGKSGMDLIPMLNLGSAGLKDAADKSAEFAKQMALAAPLADEFNDQMEELGLHSKTVGMSMVNSALPALVAITKAMADASREGGVLAGIMAGLSVGYENYKKNSNALVDKLGFGIRQSINEGGATGSFGETGGATGSWGAAKVQPDSKGIDAKTAALIKALSGGSGSGADSAFNDGIAAQIEALKKAQSTKELIAKQTVDRVTSEHKRGMMTELEYINAVSTADIAVLQSQIAAMEQEKAIVSQKKNNRKDLAALDGSIAATKEKIHSRELQQSYAVLEMEYSAAAAKQALYNEANRAGVAELDALREKNFATQREIEEIGLTARELFNLTLARQDNAIAAQQEKIAVMELYNDGSNIEAIQREIDKLGELQRARGLSVQAEDKKQISLELKGFDATAAQFESLANITGKMGDGFGKATKALQGFSGAFKTMADNEKKQYKNATEGQAAQIGGYAEMAGAAKQFFDEGSTGYEIMSAAEQAFRAVQMAMSIAAMVQDAAATKAQVVNDATTTASGMAAGGAKMFAQSGWGGFAGVAAMIAVMASLGAMSGGGGGGGGAGGAGRFGAGAGAGNNGTFNESGYELKDNGRVAVRRPSDQGSGAEGSRTQSEQDAYDEWVRTEEAADKAYTALRAANSELSTFEQRLVDVKKSIQGSGREIYDNATAGMTDAERASYDYNASLTMQANVLVDVANGTKNTSDNMRNLAKESEQLAIDLMEASGDIAGARQAQMLVDTRGFSAEEVAVYNHNQAMRDQIAAAQAGASAAREAEQAERDLAQTRYELAGRLNILLGRQTQIEFDRATEMANTTDAAAINMLKLIYGLEDINTLIDKNFATLERSVAKEKELATTRLNSAKEVQNILKTAVAATTQELSRAKAQEQLQTLLSAAKATGVLPTADTLKPVMAALGKPSSDLFGSFVDYQRDFIRTANDIRDMAGLADDQVSTEQKTIDALNGTLEAAKAQIDALRGVDNSVKDVSTAVNEVTAAIKAMTDLQASSPLFTYGMPAASSGGGGGGYYGGGGGGGSAAAFETIAGQDNKDIVAAYRTYFNRNPDEGGYQAQLNAFNNGLRGDALMKSILRGAQGGDFDTAVSRGWDPRNADSKFLKSILFPGSSSAGGGGYNTFMDSAGLAVGTNNVPYDLVTKIHQNERVMPAADNRELMARLREPSQNNAVLVAEMRALRASNEAMAKEMSRMQLAASTTAANTGAMNRTLNNLTDANGGDSLTVKVAA